MDYANDVLLQSKLTTALATKPKDIFDKIDELKEYGFPVEDLDSPFYNIEDLLDYTNYYNLPDKYEVKEKH